MPTAHVAELPDRGAVRVAGADAGPFLQGLITNDMDLLAAEPAIHAGLLSPQGKILFEFFVVGAGDTFLLETGRAMAPALVKRLSMYKLRAKVEIADVSDAFAVYVGWGAAAPFGTGNTRFADPRDGGLGWRALIPRAGSDAPIPTATAAAYHAHRISRGVPEAGRDYALSDTFPHEADFDLFAGASFTKGCYVGQEVVARMHNKTVVRKRVVRINADGELVTGVEIKVGAAAIGSVGSVAGGAGLALLRLDRVAEALDKGLAVTAGGLMLTVDPDAIARYRRSVAERPEINL